MAPAKGKQRGPCTANSSWSGLKGRLIVELQAKRSAVELKLRQRESSVVLAQKPVDLVVRLKGWWIMVMMEKAEAKTKA